MKKAIYLYILCAILPILATMCANPGTPTGGPKDRKPPLVVNSKPLPFSTGFNGKTVSIFFDENIQVKDADKKFVMSPPVFPTPKVDAHGKVLSVRMDDKVELMPNTTYTLDFADCVSDLNEGNLLENFSFTFSTGETQDSMMISGNLYDAETLDPLNGIYVVLHSNMTDTAIQKVSPIRISKTDEYGRFAIKNVPADADYMVYALDDQNRNFLYDQKGLELIAWNSSPVRPSWEIRQIVDSIPVDSLCLSQDTAQWVFQRIERDTLVYTPDSIKLFAFTESAYDQYITSDKRNERNRIDLTFNNRMKSKPQISFVGHEDSNSKMVVEYSQYNDSITVWMTDTLIYDQDSVVLAISYPVLDSLNQMVSKVDTMDFWHFKKKVDPKEEKRKNRKKGQKTQPEKIPTLSLKAPNSFGAYGMVTITSPTPYKSINWEAVSLTHKVDTIFEPMNYSIITDTINLKTVRIKAKWQPGENYELTIDSAAVEDIYGLKNNNTIFKLNTPSLDKYGTLYIEVDSIIPNGLLQLVDGKGKEVKRQNYLPKNGKVAFRYLKPGDYMVRILKDNNHNGKFDNGDFETKTQPEEFIYYMEKVTVRANWDIKVDFHVADYTLDKFVKKFKTKAKKSSRNR
ncbi:MAG: Ig-like domain-containing protein [Bacteroidia bacterium]|nr:Ig-like domain-containing protein [Bacteroidia bacterium]